MIRNKLLEMKDIKYKDFASKLIPNVEEDTIIGIRIPNIRKLAKELFNTKESKLFMNNLPHKYLEEYILHGVFISMKKDIDEVINDLRIFLPYVNNWSVCDTLSPKILKKDKEKTLDFLKECLSSNNTYQIRFGIVSLLQFYLDDNFSEEINNLVLNIKSEEYYINMAIAWYFSFALIKQYDKTIYIFENKLLDKWVHNKSLQKAIESYRIKIEIKEYLKSLKIK